MENKIQKHLYIEHWVDKQLDKDAQKLGLRKGVYMTSLLTQMASKSKQENDMK